ncbi:MAG: ABC transporter substrate binding protein [Woeseiaceae bacterium]|nr:ABC transporter substrate binding protein [Woeseiaceae bacterium]
MNQQVAETSRNDARRAPVRRSGMLLLLVLWSLTGAGCAVLERLDPAPPEPVAEPRLPPKPEPPAEIPAREAEPVVETPQPERAAEPAAEPAKPLRLAVVLSGRLPDYERVAIALQEQLDSVDVYDLEDRSLTPREMFDAIMDAETDVVVAVGIRAAAVSAGFESLPVVVAQVFNAASLDLQSGRTRGVAVLPPLARQLEIWRELNPNLSSVGAIVGSGHAALIEEAKAAAEAQGIRFEYRLAQSDRETLYLFTRLVPEIDGFWLFPDNRILSVPVLQDMLTYAERHRVQVAVFNKSLLPMGATLSATSVDTDIARTIIGVAQRLSRDAAAGVPAVTPLSEIDVTLGEDGVLAHEGEGSGGGRP